MLSGSMKAGRLGNLKESISSDIVRLGYVPRNEKGFEEYILVFEKDIPTPLAEPEIYSNAATVEGENPEVLLSYPSIRTDVILISKEKDDAFRRDNPGKIKELESFRMDENAAGKKKYVIIR
jgi:hypothetical protein